MQTSGSTPLFFAGNAKLKPFVPSDRKPIKRSGQKEEHSSKNAGESKMRIGSKHDETFAFLKDDEDMREWEANEKELDRQWYDADEDGQGRYGEMDDYYPS